MPSSDAALIWAASSGAPYWTPNEKSWSHGTILALVPTVLSWNVFRDRATMSYGWWFGSATPNSPLFQCDGYTIGAMKSDSAAMRVMSWAISPGLVAATPNTEAPSTAWVGRSRARVAARNCTMLSSGDPWIPGNTIVWIGPSGRRT